MDIIKTPPSTDVYRKEWDRIFGKKDEEPVLSKSMQKRIAIQKEDKEKKESEI